jgi:hypothetical protein
MQLDMSYSEWKGFASALLQHGAALPMTTLQLKFNIPSGLQLLDQPVSAARLRILSDALQGARQLRKLVFEDYYLFSSAGHFPHLTLLTSLSFWTRIPECAGPSALSQVSALSGLQEVVVRGLDGDQQGAVRDVLTNVLSELTSLTLCT